MKRNAFTLIELLVVIAIIAVLAGILFPVFAQAKTQAKKTRALSETRQGGLAFAMYSADWNDRLPLAHSIRANGSHRWLTLHPFPNGAIGNGWETVQDEVAVQWANSLLPYVVDPEIYFIDGQTVSAIPGEVFTGDVEALPTGLAYNGLLHTYSVGAVDRVDLVPVLWGSNGNFATLGRSSANPVMRCQGLGQCYFNSGAPAMASNPTGNQTEFFGFGNFFGEWQVWTFGDGSDGTTAFTYLDTHAVVKRVATVESPNFHAGAVEDPYAYWTAPGNGFAYWTNGETSCDDIGAQPVYDYEYVCHFRPDRTE